MKLSNTTRRSIVLACLGAGALCGQTAAGRPARVIWVMTDGLRWQEVFRGAEAALAEKDPVKREFLPGGPEENRRKLMPFFWDKMAKEGQVYGNRDAGSEAWVTNGFNFSYPGYNETLTGAPDPRVDSNDKKYNPNATLLEWLNAKPSFRGKVAAFGAWDVFPFIFNQPRAGFPVNAGYDPFEGLPGNARVRLLNELKADSPRDWEDEPFDNLAVHTAVEYLKERKPRVLYLSLGETDEWAHAGKYPEYLRSARRADQYLKLLWETAQAMPEYRGVTTLVFSPDHGRGEGPEWRNHGQKVPDSKYIWMAFLGPGVKALGERKKVEPVTQNRIAATVAALLGEDYAGSVAGRGAPIADVVRH